jgi:hypothetical protein
MRLFDISARTQQLQKRFRDVVESHLYPAAVYELPIRESGDLQVQPPAGM